MTYAASLSQSHNEHKNSIRSDKLRYTICSMQHSGRKSYGRRIGTKSTSSCYKATCFALHCQQRCELTGQWRPCGVGGLGIDPSLPHKKYTKTNIAQNGHQSPQTPQNNKKGKNASLSYGQEPYCIGSVAPTGLTPSLPRWGGCAATMATAQQGWSQSR